MGDTTNFASGLLSPHDGDAPADGLAVVPMLLEALGGTQAGLCLCDDADVIRYTNDTFRRAFLCGSSGRATDFLEAIGAAILAGRGIKLQSMPLDAFKERVRARRRQGEPRFNFSLDCQDGSWWWVNDYRLSNGWLLAVATDMSSVKHEELRLRHEHARAVHESCTDFLTGLANRRHGFALAEAALSELRPGGEPLAVALVDIDHFKQFNDRWGHEAGDKVLVHFADVLRRGLRPVDQISRIGGEEFMIVFPGLDARRAGQRLDHILHGLPPVDLGGPMSTLLPVTASAGVVQAIAPACFGDTFARADAALYAAKAKGRRRVETRAA